RALNDAIMNMIDLVDDPRIVAGGGAIEEEISRQIRLASGRLSGKEQLAYLAFADAVESIPRTLAENAGLEPVEIMAQLRHAHENGGRTVGVNIFGGGVADMFKTGVIEPAKVKIHALRSSFEAASMVLRIDDVVAATRKKEEKKKEGETETPEF
ncbi:MAG: thermosome subunit, partial [Candidatus Caldarchaeum sp.]|nr:thermosome subunit [Candidatus Caldarchaeum sp.]MDW8435954.1 TCP-1/cpn60 chaperonin family protein [Candidatus Caldarchaeum sp.]